MSGRRRSARRRAFSGGTTDGRMLRGPKGDHQSLPLARPALALLCPPPGRQVLGLSLRHHAPQTPVSVFFFVSKSILPNRFFPKLVFPKLYFPLFWCFFHSSIVRAIGSPDPVPGAHVHARMQGPWSMVHGPWIMVHGSRSMVHGPWSLDHGPWSKGHGPCSLVHGPWTIDRGPCGPCTIDHGHCSIVHGQRT